jgi:cyanamide hydratase
MADPIELYGFTAVPRSLSKLLETTAENPPAKVAAKEIAVPDSEIARKVYAYAKEHLSEQTFNHSMRVFYYGMYCSFNCTFLYGTIQRLRQTPKYTL